MRLGLASPSPGEDQYPTTSSDLSEACGAPAGPRTGRGRTTPNHSERQSGRPSSSGSGGEAINQRPFLSIIHPSGRRPDAQQEATTQHTGLSIGKTINPEKTEAHRPRSRWQALSYEGGTSRGPGSEVGEGRERGRSRGPLIGRSLVLCGDNILAHWGRLKRRRRELHFDGFISGWWRDLADNEADLRGGGEHGPKLLIQYILEPRSDVVLGEGIGHGYEQGFGFQVDGGGGLEPHPQAGDVDPVRHVFEDLLPDAGRLPVGLVQRRLCFSALCSAL